MPNGRLARCVLGPQKGTLLYDNDSGSAASITLFGQNISTSTNTQITTVVGVANTDMDLVSTVFDSQTNAVGVGTTIACLCCFNGFNYDFKRTNGGGAQVACQDVSVGFASGFFRGPVCSCHFIIPDASVCSGAGQSVRSAHAYAEFVSAAGSMFSYRCEKYGATAGCKCIGKLGPWCYICTCIGACFGADGTMKNKCNCYVKAAYGGSAIHNLNLGFCRPCVYDGCDCGGGSPGSGAAAGPNLYNCDNGCTRFTHYVGIIPGWCIQTAWSNQYCCARGCIRDWYLISACNVDTNNYEMGAQMTVNPFPHCDLYCTYDCGGSCCSRCHNACAPGAGLVPFCSVCCCCCSTRCKGPKRCMLQWNKVNSTTQCEECGWVEGWCNQTGSMFNWWALSPENFKNFCEHENCCDEYGNQVTYTRCYGTSVETGEGGILQSCCGNLEMDLTQSIAICYGDDGKKSRVSNYGRSSSTGPLAVSMSSCNYCHYSLVQCICHCCGVACGHYCNCRQGMAVPSYSCLRQSGRGCWEEIYCWATGSNNYNTYNCCWYRGLKGHKTCCAGACHPVPMSPYGYAFGMTRSIGAFITRINEGQMSYMVSNMGFQSFYCCMNTNRCPVMFEFLIGTGYSGTNHNCRDTQNQELWCENIPDFVTGLSAQGDCCSMAEFPMKYLAYNPAVCCHYMMVRTGVTSATTCALVTCCECSALNNKNPACGIFSINADCLCKFAGICANTSDATYQTCGCYKFPPTYDHVFSVYMGYDGNTCKWDCCLNAQGQVCMILKKVANFPEQWLCSYYVTPRMCVSCLFRSSFSKWTMSLYNTETNAWDPFTTNDLVNWDKSPFSTTICTNPLFTCCLCAATGKVIAQRDVFMLCMDCSGVLDYCVEMNQYERTGVVLSDGDKLFVKNHSGTETLNVQVWGYEG